MLPTSGGGPVCALRLHACTSVTPAGRCADPMATPSRTWPAKRRSVTPLAHLCHEYHPPRPEVASSQRGESHAANRVADASQRRLRERASAERKETPARRGANSRPLNAGRRTKSDAAVAAFCCCVVRKDPWTQVHPANLAGRSCPPVCPPTALDAGRRTFTSEGKRAGQRGHGRDLPARLELSPHLSGNDTPALTWDFAYELNAGPSPCTGRGPRIGKRKPA
jgi:hypothetical protein